MNTKIMRTTAVLVLLAASSNLYALPSCEDRGMSYFQNAPIVANNEWNNFIGSEIHNHGGASNIERGGRFQNFYQASHPINNHYNHMQPWMNYQASWQVMRMPTPFQNGNVFNYNATSNNKAIIRLAGCKTKLLKKTHKPYKINPDLVPVPWKKFDRSGELNDDKVGSKSGKSKVRQGKHKAAPKPMRKVSLRHTHNGRPHQHVLPARGKAHRHGKGAVGK